MRGPSSPSSPPVAVPGAARRLTLPAACVGRCAPRWKLPSLPYLGISLLLIPPLFLVPLGVAVLFVSVPGDGDLTVRLTSFTLLMFMTAAFVVPVILWIRGRHRARRRVLAGQSVPVTVYYGRLLQPTFPVAPRPRARYITHTLYGNLFPQPVLLLVAEDGRMWSATPDLVSDHTRHSVNSRNNPWIAPLMAYLDENDHPVVDSSIARRRRLPVDLNAPENERVLQTLRYMGQPDRTDPPEAQRADLYRNDPRTYGGPVPGELLLTPSGRYQGLVLHRPADAPTHSTLDKVYWSIEYLFFGTDPGECRGFYLTALTPLP